MSKAQTLPEQLENKLIDVMENTVKAVKGEDGLTLWDFAELRDALNTFLATELSTQKAEIVEAVRELIKCQECNGQGIQAGANLGVSECEWCGGDRHGLHNFEGESLDDLLDTLNEGKV